MVIDTSALNPRTADTHPQTGEEKTVGTHVGDAGTNPAQYHQHWDVLLVRTSHTGEKNKPTGLSQSTAIVLVFEPSFPNLAIFAVVKVLGLRSIFQVRFPPNSKTEVM